MPKPFIGYALSLLMPKSWGGGRRRKGNVIICTPGSDGPVFRLTFQSFIHFLNPHQKNVMTDNIELLQLQLCILKVSIVQFFCNISTPTTLFRPNLAQKYKSKVHLIIELMFIYIFVLIATKVLMVKIGSQTDSARNQGKINLTSDEIKTKFSIFL